MLKLVVSNVAACDLDITVRVLVEIYLSPTLQRCFRMLQQLNCGVAIFSDNVIGNCWD
jgi:hypothetical protein